MSTAFEFQELVQNLRHKQATIRLSAVRGLLRLSAPGDQVRAYLVERLDDPETRVREAAAAGLASFGIESLPLYDRMLRHSDKYVRRNAVWGLGRLGRAGKAYLPHLIITLKDEDPRTAGGAAQAIGSIGPQATEAIGPLAEAMRGTNVVLCRLAAKSLSQIGL
ncbi:MAG: HEAT repeat domain-containing protein, partial [Gemmataceae bacterium]